MHGSEGGESGSTGLPYPYRTNGSIQSRYTVGHVFLLGSIHVTGVTAASP